MSVISDLAKVLAAADVVVKEWQATTECEVCCNTVFSEEFEFVKFSDPETWFVDLEHGKGCYVINEDGGGHSSVDVPREVAMAIEMKRIAAALRDLLPSDEVVEALQCMKEVWSKEENRYCDCTPVVAYLIDLQTIVNYVLPTLAKLAEGK